MQRCLRLAVMAVSLAPAALRAEPRPLQIDDLFAFRQVGEPTLSPDGAFVAYTVRTIDPKKDKADTDVWMVPLAGGDAIRLTASPKPETRPRFSPDGKYLAFLSDREGKKTQVFLLARAGGEAVKLTDYKGGVSDLAWSPDSSRLALVVSDEDKDAIDDGDKTTDDARKTPPPIVLDRLQFKRDGEGFLRNLRQHIHVFALKPKASFQVTTGSFDDSQPAWSPDGREIAFVSNRTEEPDSNRNTQIFVVAPRVNAALRALTSARTSARSPAFSPDGTLLAYVEGGDPADIWYGVEHLAIVPAAGGTSRPLAAELDRNPRSPRFAPDGRSLLFLLEDRGNVHLARIPVAGGAVERVVAGERTLTAFDVGKKGEIVVLESQPDHPAEVSVVAPPGLKRLTHVNDETLAGLRLAKVERQEAKSADGTVIDFFLIRPAAAPEGTRLPTLLRIHGGPVSQYENQFVFEWQLLAANGYAVVAPNPRGSSGRGRDFSRAIWADWGGKDFEDVMAAVEATVARGTADPDRLGVGGWSYGGILTDWTIYRTSRFKAAIAGAGIANALAGYGTDHYQYEYEAELGLPWKAKDVWLNLSKPFLEADKIKTPTLFLCGEVDWNVPLINSEQMYQSLRRLAVPTELVVYPGQSHGISAPSYQKDRYERYLAWYDRYLKPSPATGGRPAPEATSLLGQPLFPPPIPADQKKSLDDGLAEALAAFAKDPDGAESILLLGRRTAALGRYRDAIAIFSRGVDKYPGDIRFLRFRGHRYLSVRELDKAIADLQKAADLIASQNLKDAVEPDVPPNPKRLPTATTNYNVYYHLALARYLKGDYAAAEQGWRASLRFAEGSPDGTAGSTRWLYSALRHEGRASDAAELVAKIPKDLAVVDAVQYMDLLRLYKGERAVDQVLALATDGLNLPTLGYGVADFLLLNGDPARARAILQDVVRGPQWAAFGAIAAEAELARLQ
jgi:dipeptidyl aminopeptidase/acylaminoacyl peptidase/tetratricopeptide (TPR) repeat protein